MRDDPNRYYAVLGLRPNASEKAISTAFRAAARKLHPDVPVTGDAAAFIRAREAYDVLSHPLRRAAYDRSASVDAVPEETSLPNDPVATEIPAEAWWPRAGLPLGIWAGVAAFALVAVTLGLHGVARRPPPETPIPPPTTASRVKASPTPPTTAATTVPVAVEPGSNGYILPEAGPATLWKLDQLRGDFVPVGKIEAFTPLVIGRSVADHGMLGVTAAGGRSGFVYARQVAPGDAATAERERCIYEAGAPPTNNEVLARKAAGSVAITVENHREQPAVVKLRALSGEPVIAVFVEANGHIVISNVPAGSYRFDYAFGDLWSRSCSRFMAGMRAQRALTVSALTNPPETPAHFTIPFTDGLDESDEEFNGL